MTRPYARLLVIALAGCLLLPFVVAACSALFSGQGLSAGFLLKAAVVLAVLAGIAAALRPWLSRLEVLLDEEGRLQAEYLDAWPARTIDLAIAGAAAFSLLLELAVIRWQGTVFQIFALYKNFGLLACFAGLGLGYMLAGRDRIPLAATTPLIATQFALLLGLRGLVPWERLRSITVIPYLDQMVWDSLWQGLATYFVLAVVFLLTALAFLPIGQVAGRLMGRRAQLRSYGLNLLGSLAGVLLMLVVSYRWTPPAVWFGLSFTLLLVFSARRPLALAAGGVGAITALMLLSWPNPFFNRVYSPYQLIEIGYTRHGFMLIRAAGSYYQRAIDFSTTHQREDDLLRRARAYYAMPYRLRPEARSIAIVGSGVGNDVAAALRGTTARVDAIEIDPAILQAGTQHPEHPYADARVRAVVNDARAFLRRPGDRYDMIVFALLDSHILLSHASSVRQDSYVYTVEALREARSRLEPGGLLVVSFSILNPALARKFHEMFRVAFDGAAPAVVRAGYDGAVVYFQSKDGGFQLPPGTLAGTGFEEGTGWFADASARTEISTDDWPFLFLPRRVYPVAYLLVLGLALAGTVALTRGFVKERPPLSDASFFLLGSGFMLVETKGITEAGLTFGNTWLVVGVVIAGVLLMAFLANLVVARLGTTRPDLAYLFLLASLVAGYVIAARGGFPSTTLGRAGTAVILTLPMFFSGIVFSIQLAARGAIAAVMAANLLGAMLGGLLEYNAMAFGFRSLYLLAIGLYALAWLAHRVPKRAAVTAPVTA